MAAIGKVGNASVTEHGDRAYTDQEINSHNEAADPHGDRAYADGLIVGLWDDRGNFDASGGDFPIDATHSGTGIIPDGAYLSEGVAVRNLAATTTAKKGFWLDQFSFRYTLPGTRTGYVFT